VRPGQDNSGRILILKNHPEEGIGRYARRLRRLGIAHATVQVHAGEPLPPLESCDAIIIGGTPNSGNGGSYHDSLLEEARYLKNALDLEKPILGISTGARLLAQLLGAEVKKSPTALVGAFPVRLTAAGHSDPLFQGFPKIFPAFLWQLDAIDIPPWGLRLASGWESPNQGFRMGSAVGLHFHLEFTAEDSRELVGVFKGLLREGVENRPRLIRENLEHEARMAELADRLLDNFLAAAEQ
jgi:GMP synthase-like glutamine amidotransferase